MHHDAGPPHWKLTQIQKLKNPADDRTDGRTYYTATQGILCHGLRPHALRAITGCANDRQKLTGTTVQRDRETDGPTYKLDWTPLGSFVS